MKRLFYIPLLWGILTTGCTGESVVQQTGGDPVPVTLPVSEHGGSELQTRASGPMTGWGNTQVYMVYGESVTAAFAGFERALDGIVDTKGKTSLQPLLFYPLFGETIFLRGVYPRENIQNLEQPGNTFAGNEIHYTIDGHQDIMVSNVLSGSMNNTIASQAVSRLSYNHLLTQLSFTVVSPVALPSTIRIKDIRIAGVRKQALLDLHPDTAWNDPGMLTFTDTPTSKLAAYSSATGLTIGTTVSSELGYVLFQPGVAFAIEVEFTSGDVVTLTSIDSAEGDLTLPGTTVAGTKYKVALTLTTTSAKPTVSAAWTKTVTTGIDDNNWW